MKLANFYSIMDTKTSVVLKDEDGVVVFGGNIENAPESYELYEVVDYQLVNGFYVFSLKKDNAVKPVRVIDVFDYIDTSWRVHLVSEDFTTCYYNGVMGEAPTTYDLWYVSKCSIDVWKDEETPEYTITIRRTKKEQK